jgi:UDP-2,4-diacetamido-2,4,6-trideoxy-beta-L-altropyranose hydrolase
MPNGTLIIRADANLEIATGHVMRCLALAQEWRDAGGNVVYAMADSTPAVDRRLRSEGIETFRLKTAAGSAYDVREVAALAHDRKAGWVVVDGYRFDSGYQRHIKNAGLQLLLLDDTGQSRPYFADVILNQNVYAVETMYRIRERYTELLLGTRYALLRREFRPWRNWQREMTGAVRNVLITMGGSDPDNVTALVLQSLRFVKVEGIEITVVVGGSNPHAKSLREAASHLPRTLLLQNGVTNMAELMAWADLAISAGGGTCYELALMQVPMVVIALAENQVTTCQALARENAAVNAGLFQDLDPHQLARTITRLVDDAELRRSRSENARRLVDGSGAHRVWEQLSRREERQVVVKLRAGAR